MAPNALSSLRRWLLSSPPAEWALNQLRELLIGAIKQGRVPKHIAFVMDGNRRYARSHRIETVEGHNLGFEALARILEVCYKSGVTHVTIYAFSIENFKRSKHEVDALMDMAKIKLTQLSQHGELLDRYGARVRVLGQRDLLKQDVLEAIDRAADMTKHNDKTVLNVCFPYTSREEMTQAIRRTVQDFSTPVHEKTERERRAVFKEERISKTILKNTGQDSDGEAQHERSNMLEVPKPLHSPSSSSTSLSAQSASDYDSKRQTQIQPSTTIPADHQTDDPDDHDQDHDHDLTSISSSSTLPPSVAADSTTNAPSSSTQTSPPTSPSFPSTKPLSKSVTFNAPVYPPADTITSQTISSYLYTFPCPPLDLCIRTSGVERLSDFMLWQCHQDTKIVFLDVLWPEFDLWGFLPVLWEWQWWGRKERLREEDGPAGKMS